MNIFVAKLNFKTTTDGLREAFEQFGTVSYAKVITDHETGKSKGYGFVEMDNEEEADKAIEALDNVEFDGSVIVVKKARPREENPNFNRGGGGGYNNNGGGGGFNKYGNNKPYQSRPRNDYNNNNNYNKPRY